MTVAEELQNIVADLSAAIAGRKTYGRADLETMRRRLTTAATELRRDDRAGTVSRLLLEDLCAGVEKGVADIAAVARRARAQVEAQAGAGQ
ncbi:MAG TPA: hypothetical protein VFT56_01135 [Sphingomonas sp.]|nr:hypothetical protein [Sphingomonas sp.]